MGMFDEFNKKEIPFFTGITRGVGGFGFGASASSGGGGASKLSATGGDIDGQPGGNGYKYHVFTSSGALAVSSPGPAEILLVAGGGSGGSCDSSNGAGGGGAGGVVHHTLLDVTGPLTITIGDGGSHPNAGATVGNNGADSTIVSPTGPWTLTAVGGGGGGQFNVMGKIGGSGGGGGGYGGGYAYSVGLSTQQHENAPFTSQAGFNQYGFDGGVPITSNPGNGSGGGGSVGVGKSHDSGASPDVPTSNGGNGRPFTGFAGNIPAFGPLPSAWKTATGPTGLYAGGGAGENPYTVSATSASGGLGGGGGPDAGTGDGGANGITNTGSGGAGMRDGPYTGDGGKGIFIIRYPE